MEVNGNVEVKKRYHEYCLESLNSEHKTKKGDRVPALFVLDRLKGSRIVRGPATHSPQL